MKFWELVSICRTDVKSLKVLNDEKYLKYWTWYLDFDSIVGACDRSILDFELPTSLCKDVLKSHSGIFYVSNGSLRLNRQCEDDLEISIYDAYISYGGSILEEVCERGSQKIG